jgi:hypothetical protein
MLSARFATGCDGTRATRSDASAYCTATAPVNRHACRSICCSWSSAQCRAGQHEHSGRGEGRQRHGRIHTHTAGTARDWEGRAGGEQHMQLVAQVPRRPADTSLHTRRKQADHTAHHALPVPALTSPAPLHMHDPLRMPCTCMSVPRACVHPRLVNAFGTVRVFWQGDVKILPCKVEHPVPIKRSRRRSRDS